MRQLHVCLFLRKDFEQKKKDKIATTKKISILLWSFCVWKIVAFDALCSFVFVLLVGFCLFCVFVLQKFFLKNPEIVLITLFTILLKFCYQALLLNLPISYKLWNVYSMCAWRWMVYWCYHRSFWWNFWNEVSNVDVSFMKQDNLSFEWLQQEDRCWVLKGNAICR